MAQRSNKKTAIILSVVSLIATAALLAASAYAWIVWRTDFDANQNVYLHAFNVNLTESAYGQSGAVTINSSEYYPETRESAVAAYGNGERQSYTFAVTNTGRVVAQIRLQLRVVEDDNYGKTTPAGIEPLAHQFSFTYRIFTDDNNRGDFAATDDNYRLFDRSVTSEVTENGSTVTTVAPAGEFTSFKAATNSQFLVSSGADYTANALGTLTAATENAAGESVYIELLPFLSQSATVESTGVSTEDPSAVSPKLKFVAYVSALQEMAVFPESDVVDLAIEGVPMSVRV